MTSSSVCACKGVRTCLRCESLGNTSNEAARRQTEQTWRDTYQLSLEHACNRLIQLHTYSGPERCSHLELTDCKSLEFEGIKLIENFITLEQESKLVQCIDSNPWKDSQSGRRKQDYGPRPNFKKKKLKLGSFSGLPAYSKSIVSALHLLPGLDSFKPVEQCNLEYLPERGSAIDPHIDDEWLWGEQLITLNLLSDTFLTFVKEELNVEVRVPLPRLSLLIVSGAARHSWKHAIYRRDIYDRRIAITFRELSVEFREPGGGQHEIGEKLEQIACQFDGQCCI